MAIYLQVRAGPLHLLVDALGVHEVLSLGDLAVGGQGGHIEWRHQVINAVAVHTFFGQEKGQRLMGVVYSATEGETPLMLEVDEVVGLRNITANQWLPMPRLPQASQVFFDALIGDLASDVQVYRLRRPLDSLLFQPALVAQEITH
jgi:hypothetical protein